MTETGGPAFPGSNAPGFDPGISKRDYFAAAALTGLCAFAGDETNGNMHNNCGDPGGKGIAEYAYEIADAMLRAGGHVDE